MKKNTIHKTVVTLISLISVLSVVFTLSGCKKSKEVAPETTDSEILDLQQEPKVREIGSGSTVFSLTVADAKDNKQLFVIKTDETTLIAALQNISFLNGEHTSDGFVIKSVNGIRADSNKNEWVVFADDKRISGDVEAIYIEPSVIYSIKLQNIDKTK